MFGDFWAELSLLMVDLFCKGGIYPIKKGGTNMKIDEIFKDWRGSRVPTQSLVKTAYQ